MQFVFLATPLGGSAFGLVGLGEGTLSFITFSSSASVRVDVAMSHLLIYQTLRGQILC